MLAPLQKLAAQAIVNIFETGRVGGDYGRVTVLPGDTGHLTYGRSQTTLASGNLYLLIKAYCTDPGALYAGPLGGYLDRLSARDPVLDGDANLRGLLRQCGLDPAMQAQQDAFFDRVYWSPALQAAASIGAATALGTSIVYDSHIHGSWAAMRDRTQASAGGNAAAVGEEAWFTAYVETRRAWLAGNANTLLQKTVYRMDAFKGLIAQKLWDLELPFTVRGLVINEENLGVHAAPVRASAADAGEVVLQQENPPQRGERVLRLQRALAGEGIEVVADGVFGAATKTAVREFQTRKGLVADGIVGPATRAALALDN